MTTSNARPLANTPNHDANTTDIRRKTQSTSTTMKSAAIAVVIAAITISAGTATAAEDASLQLTQTCSAVNQNTDYYGADIANKPGAVADCCGLCVQQSGCTAWTWSDYNGGTCWLKSSAGTPLFAPGKTSATRLDVVPQCGITFPDTDFAGQDIANVPSADKNCCKPCQQQPGCMAWTWSNYNGGTCWLKSGQGVHQAAPGKISGTTIGPDTPVAPTTGTAPTTAIPTTTSPSGVCKGSCLIANYQPYGWATAPNAPPCWIQENGYFSCFDYDATTGKCPWTNEVDCGFKKSQRTLRA